MDQGEPGFGLLANRWDNSTVGTVWTPIEHRAVVGDDLAIRIDSKWGLRSSEITWLPAGATSEQKLVIVPSPVQSPETMTLYCIDGWRTLAPVQLHLLQARKMGRAQALLALTVEEARQSPTLSVREVIPPVASGHRYWRGLGATGSLSYSLTGHPGADPPLKLAFKMPAYATADFVGLRCAVRFGDDLETMARIVDLFDPDAGSIESENSSLHQADFSAVVVGMALRLRGLKRFLGDSAKKALDLEDVSGADVLLKAGVISRGWRVSVASLADLADRLDELTQRLAGLDNPNEESLGRLHREAAELVTAKELDFTLLAKLDERDELELGQLGLPDGQPFGRVVVKSIDIPFALDRPLGVLSRSNAILLMLAGLLLTVSMIDLSWLGDSFSTLKVVSAKLDADGIRDALTTVLLFVPAILYGALFADRPKTPLQNRAERVSFVVLSAVVALPIVAALLTAIGAPLAVVSRAAVVSAVSALLVAGVLWYRLRPGTLHRRRRDIVARDALSVRSRTWIRDRVQWLRGSLPKRRSGHRATVEVSR